MYGVKAILILCWFMIIPVCTGMIFTGKCKDERRSLGFAYLWGYVFFFGVFQLISIPLIFLKIDFQVLVYLIMGIMLIMTVISLGIGWKSLHYASMNSVKRIKNTPWTIWLALLLIAVQCLVYVFFMSIDMDDAFYVATATTTVETGQMFQYDAYTGEILKKLPSRYVLSPFPIFLAFISQCVNMHPASVAHTIMPVFLLLLGYVVYGALGSYFFKGDKKAVGIFLCFLSVIHIFSYYTVYTQGTFMLIRIWQGKAVLAGVLLPALFYACIRTMKETGDKKDWILLGLIMMACSLVSSMGIMLAPIMTGIFGILYGLLKWDWKKLGKAFLCCIPNLVYAGMYLFIS